MTENNFLWLINWYHNHCDGDWEHDKRIHIGTIDNPGWSMSINLNDTELENKSFQKIEIDRSEDDWIFCTVKNNQFQSYCGSLNFYEVLQIFQNWAEDRKNEILQK